MEGGNLPRVVIYTTFCTHHYFQLVLALLGGVQIAQLQLKQCQVYFDIEIEISKDNKANSQKVSANQHLVVHLYAECLG